MKTFDELILTNYSHKDCTPLMNIMRLPENEAFVLAAKFTEEHSETTSFYRFADFDNYYLLQKKQGEYLYSRFVELGGMPEEKHPLSFVIEGSDYLYDWFDGGIISKLCLRDRKNLPNRFLLQDRQLAGGRTAIRSRTLIR